MFLPDYLSAKLLVARSEIAFGTRNLGSALYLAIRRKRLNLAATDGISPLTFCLSEASLAFCTIALVRQYLRTHGASLALKQSRRAIATFLLSSARLADLAGNGFQQRSDLAMVNFKCGTLSD